MPRDPCVRSDWLTIAETNSSRARLTSHREENTNTSKLIFQPYVANFHGIKPQKRLDFMHTGCLDENGSFNNVLCYVFKSQNGK